MMKNKLIFIIILCLGYTAHAQYNSLVYDTLDSWLTVGIPIQLVFDRLGAPDSVGDIETWGATGMDYRYYQYSQWGLSFYSEIDNVSETVFDIIVKSESPFLTSRGVRIGDSRQSVLKIYKDCINFESNTTQDTISIINNIYNGTFFFFDDDNIIMIEIGSLAE